MEASELIDQLVACFIAVVAVLGIFALGYIYYKTTERTIKDLREENIRLLRKHEPIIETRLQDPMEKGDPQ